MNAIEIYENAIRMFEINGEITLGEFEEMIKPLEDVAPVVHGYWIVHRNAEISHGRLITNYECSICHTWSRYHSNYCPDCGAKMDLKEAEDERGR